jgi:hypothetical protein
MENEPKSQIPTWEEFCRTAYAIRFTFERTIFLQRLAVEDIEAETETTESREAA